MYYEMAPMEGITTYIYRRAHFHYFGEIDRYYTPFISTHKDKALSHKELQEILPEHNEGMQVIPQILTSSAQEFVKMAKELAQMGYTQVNLNCGCPSATVTTKHKGAGVLENPKQLDQMLAEIFEKCPIQVSIKTRIGMEQDWEWEDILEVYSHYQIAELIIHPRVRQDFYKNTPRLEPVKAAFSQRRKTAANAIANGLHLPKAQVLAGLEAAGLDIRSRPEQLTLQDYAALQKALSAIDNGT